MPKHIILNHAHLKSNPDLLRGVFSILFVCTIMTLFELGFYIFIVYPQTKQVVNNMLNKLQNQQTIYVDNANDYEIRNNMIKALQLQLDVQNTQLEANETEITVLQGRIEANKIQIILLESDSSPDETAINILQNENTEMENEIIDIQNENIQINKNITKTQENIVSINNGSIYDDEGNLIVVNRSRDVMEILAIREKNLMNKTNTYSYILIGFEVFILCLIMKALYGRIRRVTNNKANISTTIITSCITIFMLIMFQIYFYFFALGFQFTGNNELKYVMFQSLKKKMSTT